MRNWILIFVIMLMGGFFLNGTRDDDDFNSQKRMLYLKEYRYKKDDSKTREGFLEYKIVVKTFMKIYFDFSSLGAQNFLRDTVLYAELLLTKTSFINVFLMICDRMVRNIAFDPRLYEIDIRTGKAVDHFVRQLKK